MPSIVIYEYCVNTGVGAAPASVEHGLWREGHAMHAALVGDFQGAGWAVEPSPGRAAGADATIVIAPEFDGHLERLVAEFRHAGANVWAGTTDAITICADKRLTARALQWAGVPTPELIGPGSRHQWPRVVKPALGAGSTATTLVYNPSEMIEAIQSAGGMVCITQEFVPGTPMSVAFLIGPGGIVPLPACTQTLSDDGRFQYLGGETPIEASSACRAALLARRAIDAVPGLAGFVGVDLLLGERDVVIEINPRLCTSYLGLRQSCRDNLASAWATVAAGEPPSQLMWRAGVTRWDSAGEPG